MRNGAPAEAFLTREGGFDRTCGDGERIMSGIDLVVAALGVGAFVVLCAGVIANAHCWHDDQRRFGQRER
jgi:hypothetical protein